VKPGSGTTKLFESAKGVISQLSHDDLIILCGGTNDYHINGFSLTFWNIKNYMMNNTHTNIPLTLCAP
jgi:hypothetical protein